MNMYKTTRALIDLTLEHTHTQTHTRATGSLFIISCVEHCVMKWMERFKSSVVNCLERKKAAQQPANERMKDIALAYASLMGTR